MPRDIEATITELRELLPYVARDAKRYHEDPNLLFQRSHELGMATRAIRDTLVHPSFIDLAKNTFLRVRIGSTALETNGFEKLYYGLTAPTYETAQPGEEFNLLFERKVPIDILNPYKLKPVFGQMQYFDVPTLALTLEDGGDLLVSELKPKAS